MRKIIDLLVVSFLLVGLAASAQTEFKPWLPDLAASLTADVVTNPVPAANTGPSNLGQLLGLSPSATQLGSDFGAFFVDAVPYVSNDIVNLQVGGLYDKSLAHGKIGGFADIGVPISQQASLGFGGAYIGKQWFDGTVNLKLGSTFTWPVIGKWIGPVYHAVSSGPDYDFHTTKGQTAIGAFNMMDSIKKFDISKKVTLQLDFGIGEETHLPGVLLAGSTILSYHF